MLRCECSLELLDDPECAAGGAVRVRYSDENPRDCAWEFGSEGYSIRHVMLAVDQVNHEAR